MKPEIVRSRADLRAQATAWRKDGHRIGAVPTMGALHEGHLSLVRRAAAECDKVIVTLFVNPKQFNDQNDLQKYPRTEEDDRTLLQEIGPDILYAPDVKEIYPAGFATTISVSGITDSLCGSFRPGHFDGVATVVCKLFLQTGADCAYFGEKDYQQLQVVRRMASDLDIPIDVIGCPTIREADGLAMSSRNRLLSPEGREKAVALPRALVQTAEAISRGANPQDSIEAAIGLLETSGFVSVEYLELRGADDLAPITTLDRPARLLAAAKMDDVRLIDNVPVLPGT